MDVALMLPTATALRRVAVDILTMCKETTWTAWLRNAAIGWAAIELYLQLQKKPSCKRGMPLAVRKPWMRGLAPYLPLSVWGMLNSFELQFRDRSENLKMSVDAHRVFGSTHYLKLPFVPIIVVTDEVESIKYIWKDRLVNFPKGPVWRTLLHELLGEGIFNSDGPEWYWQRKTAAPMFTHVNFATFMFEVFSKRADSLASVLLQHQNKEIDLQPFIQKFTFDSIVETGFGESIGALESSEDIPFMLAFDHAQAHIEHRFFVPQWMWKMQRFFGIGFEGKLAKAIVEIRKFAEAIVERHAEQIKSDDDHEKNEDFLSLMMKSQPDSISDTNLWTDVALNFMIAGRDTTAVTLSWLLYELTQHPDVLAKMRAELFDLSENPSLEDIDNNLVYTKAVIDETLRLHPPVPRNSRMAVEDDVLPDGTFVPSGCWISYMPYAMNRNKQRWGENAEEFDPNRWFKFTKYPTAYEFPVFHGGPRLCLGYRMAYLEIKLCLRSLLTKIDIELACKPEDVTYAVSLTLAVRNTKRAEAIPVIIRPYANPALKRKVPATESSGAMDNEISPPSRSNDSTRASISSNGDAGNKDEQKNGRSRKKAAMQKSKGRGSGSKQWIPKEM
eukprot:GEMP01015786.1.p1 GENE.GEMP01015786.1~~GEMP01015786.1.p1  ORF type:complete len:614 (+),score=118.05 GEMP01015786.1:233-2074(+)